MTQNTIQKLTEKLVQEMMLGVESEVKQQFEQSIGERLARMDFNAIVAGVVKSYIDQKLKEFEFPNNSIPASALKLGELELSGDQIRGGIITNFASTGIDDKATACVVTILDQAVVVENNLVTLDLTVQGNLDVKGTVDENSAFYQQLQNSVTNSVQQGLNTNLFTGYSKTIFELIKKDGLDLGKITVNGNPVIEDNRIGYNITESNLQKLGQLRELQVSGESLFADSLYVGNKRIGVNTIEPSAALAVWDEEVEITVSKEKSNVGRFGTPRGQDLIIGSNKHNNIVVRQDGTTQIDNLQIGSLKLGSSSTPPNYASTRGHIVFNENPNPGGPMGWVCLGAANWANFGIID